MKIELKNDTYRVKDDLKKLGYIWNGISWVKEIESNLNSLTSELDRLFDININIDSLLNTTHFVGADVHADNDYALRLASDEEKYEL